MFSVLIIVRDDLLTMNSIARNSYFYFWFYYYDNRS